MKAVICDFCKKPVNRWYKIEISIGASHREINVTDMIANWGTKEICADCMAKIKNKLNGLEIEI